MYFKNMIFFAHLNSLNKVLSHAQRLKDFVAAHDDQHERSSQFVLHINAAFEANKKQSKIKRW